MVTIFDWWECLSRRPGCDVNRRPKGFPPLVDLSTSCLMLRSAVIIVQARLTCVGTWLLCVSYEVLPMSGRLKSTPNRNMLFLFFSYRFYFCQSFYPIWCQSLFIWQSNVQRNKWRHGYITTALKFRRPGWLDIMAMSSACHRGTNTLYNIHKAYKETTYSNPRQSKVLENFDIEINQANINTLRNY